MSEPSGPPPPPPPHPEPGRGWQPAPHQWQQPDHGGRPARSRATVVTWVLALVLVVGAAATGALALTGVLGGSEKTQTTDEAAGTSAGDDADDKPTDDPTPAETTVVDGPVAPDGTWAPDEWTVTGADLAGGGLESASGELVFFPREVGVPVLDGVALVQLWAPESLVGVLGVDAATGEHLWSVRFPADAGFLECALQTFDAFVCTGASPDGEGVVFTLDADTGARTDLWSGAGTTNRSLVSSEGFITHHDNLVEMYDDQGESAWTLEPGDSQNLRATALTADRVVVLTSESVSLHDTADGAELWSEPVVSATSAKILDDGSVFVWSGQRTQLFSPDGEQIISEDGQFSNISWFSTAASDVLVLVDDASVHAHSTTDRDEIWSVDNPSMVSSLTFDDTVVLSGLGEVIALDLEDGAEAWTQSLDLSATMLSDGTNLLVQELNGVTAYSPADGTVVWSVDAADVGIHSLTYVTSFNGRVALAGTDIDGASITHVFTP